MYARVTQFHILPEKVDGFLAAFEAAASHSRQQKGFRALMAFRTGTGATVEIRVISVWNTIEDLQASEQNFYLYQALAKCLAFSKGFPLIEGQDVLFFSSATSERSISADETQF